MRPKEEARVEGIGQAKETKTGLQRITKDTAAATVPDARVGNQSAVSVKKPEAIPPDFDAIARYIDAPLRKLAGGPVARYVLWKFELDRRGEWTKIPYRPNGRKASSINEKTWCVVAKANAAYEAGGFDGMGIVLGEVAEGAWLAGCDLDKAKAVAQWRDKLPAAYVEVSAGGRGVHALCIEALPKPGRKHGGIELYNSGGRYFTLTGRAEQGAKLRRVSEGDLDPLRIEAGFSLTPDRKVASYAVDDEPDGPLEEYVDLTADERALLNRLRRATRPAELYDKGTMRTRGGQIEDDESERDYALVAAIAAECVTQDPRLINRLARASACYREKWDELRSGGKLSWIGYTIANMLARKQSELTAEFARAGDEDSKGDQQPGDGWQSAPGEPRVLASLVRRVLIAEPHVAFVSGEWSTYKSTAMVGLGMHIATDRDWFGARVRPGLSVWYVAAEDHYSLSARVYAQLVSWMQDEGKKVTRASVEAAAARLEESGRFQYRGAIGRLTKDRAAELVEDIRHRARKINVSLPALLLLDMYSKFIVGDPNAADVVNEFMDAAHLIAHELGCVVAVIAHPNRSGTSIVAGNMNTENAARGLISFEKSDSNIKMTVKKIDGAQADFHLLLQPVIVPLEFLLDKPPEDLYTAVYMRFVGGEAAEDLTTARLRTLLQALEAQPRASQRELMRALKMTSHNGFERLIDSAKERELINVNAGKCIPTEQGRVWACITD